MSLCGRSCVTLYRDLSRRILLGILVQKGASFRVGRLGKGNRSLILGGAMYNNDIGKCDIILYGRAR